jgi:hypothetical protein
LVDVREEIDKDKENNKNEELILRTTSVALHHPE